MNTPSPPPTAARRAAPRQRLHPVVWVAIGFAVLTLLAVAVGLWQYRRDTLAAQQRSLATLATAISSEVERGLLGLVDALWTTAQQVREGRILLRDANAAAVLRDRARLLPLVDTFWVLDGQDRVVTASTTAPLPALRTFLPFQGVSPEAPDLALSAPSPTRPTASCAWRWRCASRPARCRTPVGWWPACQPRNCKAPSRAPSRPPTRACWCDVPTA